MMFKDKDDNLMGYEDSFGTIMIEPKFTFITDALIFENIIPVFEKTNLFDAENYETSQYYLLKNGKKVGIDSLYIFDFSLDCENENKIRFRDHKTDKVGYFNSNGEVTIPAIYNDGRPFYNGFAIVIKEAKRYCWDGIEYSKEDPCEHWSWLGNMQIINEKNELILDDIDLEKFENIDWYSLTINPKQININDITFTAQNGNLYSFKNNQKEFEKWFYEEFLIKSGDQTYFYLNSFETVALEKNKNLKSKEFKNSNFQEYAWAVDTKENVYKNNKQFISKIRKGISSKNLKIDIINDSSPLLFENNKSYYDNCGGYLSQKYPFFKIYITKQVGRSVQYYLGFIRTETGYKLVEIG